MKLQIFMILKAPAWAMLFLMKYKKQSGKFYCFQNLLLKKAK